MKATDRPDLTEALPLGTVLSHPCPDCGGEMVLRDSKFGFFYGCRDYPACKSTHGAHKNGQPLGIPATTATKQARMLAHAEFDLLWKNGHMARSEAYVWMQGAMELSAEEAHIGRFTTEQCDRLILAVDKFFEALP
jgi:ssDNA-binding Zn-finger/Zn-ribbon topoisomerase 1